MVLHFHKWQLWQCGKGHNWSLWYKVDGLQKWCATLCFCLCKLGAGQVGEHLRGSKCEVLRSIRGAEWQWERNSLPGCAVNNKVLIVDVGYWLSSTHSYKNCWLCTPPLPMLPILLCLASTLATLVKAMVEKLKVRELAIATIQILTWNLPYWD